MKMLMKMGPISEVAAVANHDRLRLLSILLGGLHRDRFPNGYDARTAPFRCAAGFAPPSGHSGLWQAAAQETYGFTAQVR